MKIVIASLNPAIERLLVVARNESGTVHRLLRSETIAGGKGVNVARVLRQLDTPEFVPVPGHRDADLQVLLVGPLGGPTGDLEAALLAEESLATVTTPIRGWTRVNEVLIDESEPERATVYNAEGPALNAEEAWKLRRLAIEALDDASFLVCTGSLPLELSGDFYGDWIAEARRRGIRTLLDAHGIALAAGAAAVPTVVKVNRDELAEIAPAGPGGGDALVDEWIASGIEAVIITDGSAPTSVHTPAQRFECDPPRVVTRSSVGSGDAFTAGLLWSLVTDDGADWPQHLAVAAACGAHKAANTLARLAGHLPPAQLLRQVRVRDRDSSRHG